MKNNWRKQTIFPVNREETVTGAVCT